MSAAEGRRQGQPVLFLGLLLAGWCLARLLTWQSPWPEVAPLTEALQFARAEVDESAKLPPLRTGSGVDRSQEVDPGSQDRATLSYRPSLFEGLPPSEPLTPANPAALFGTHRTASGHALLFARGMASLPLPRSVARLIDRQAASPGWAEQSSHDRWRFDGWVVLREGGSAAANGAQTGALATYGASQMGAVLAYRLNPGEARDPSAYLRASRALVEGGETELAAGGAIRPFGKLPVKLHAELRVTERPGQGPAVRPAAFLAGGLGGVELGHGLAARGYAQAGYVAGDFATPFADGALVVDREVARFDLGRVSLGGTARGGVQRGAARLDLGPSMTLDLTLDNVPARIEADYRWRVAGDATPGHGGVLTLSTGF
ncbi:hypothetical protein [Qipengyuania flava]|uniref:hypothetical protein n=1 Tax=Qipengyuania flava TaxID=192812 RepID=UPI00273E3743|nr:hypothetical protein [Qipengyuania flava]